MIQVDAQRGVKWPHQRQSHPSVRMAGAVNPAVVHPVQQPRFAGGMAALSSKALGKATDGLLPIFQKITEVFLVGFLAQDVVAMWLPRVGTSLKVGRIPYDPQQDPEAKNLPFKDQVKKWIAGNVRGLNWVNFNEESKREFATGPGVLMIPAVMYAAARRLFGKSSVEMSYGSLDGLSQGFKEHLAQSALKDVSGRVAPEAYRAELAKYLSGIFDDTELRDTPMGKGKTYGQFLDDWARRWTDGVFGVVDEAKGKNQKKYLQALADELKQTLTAPHTGFNRIYRMGDYVVNGKPVNGSWLHRSDHVWVSFQKGKEATQKPISALLHDIERWSDFAKGVWQKKTANGTGVLAETLPNLVDKTLKSMVAKKFFIAVGTTLLSGYYLVKLAFWAQNHDSYGATRLLNKNAPGAQGHAAVPGGAQPAGQQVKTQPQQQPALVSPQPFATPVVPPAPAFYMPPAYPSVPFYPAPMFFQGRIQGGPEV